MMNDKKTQILNLLQPNQLIELSEIQERLNLRNREARRLISEIAQEYPIISLSNQKGYMRITKDNEFYEDIVDHQINDYLSRIKVLQQRIKILKGEN